MRFKARQFYSSQEDFLRIHFGLKQTVCPHCRLTGYLNLHGYLRGYDEKIYGKRIIRGRRIFCSNRGRRRGCGCTFSILAAGVLKKFIAGAKSFWRFLNNIAGGLNKIQSFKPAMPNFSQSSCYRFMKKFQITQSKIRSKLLRLCPPPVCASQTAVIQTIFHLRAAFKNSVCPITAFQKHFQTAFL